MTAESVAYITISILICSNLLGLIYSLIVLYGKSFTNFQIQSKEYRNGLFLSRMPLFLFNLLVLLALSGVGAYFLFDFFDTTFSLWIVLVQVAVAFFIDDICFYFYHRWLHENKYMLKHVHSIHHRATKPFPLEYLYAHPFEWMLGMIGSVIAFTVILIFSPINIWAFWIFGALRNLHEIHIHSDLTLPVISKTPLISTTRHHDDHHSKLNGNYASTLHWLDRLFKTEFKPEK